MYPGGTFIGKTDLEIIIGAQMIPLSYISLKTHIKSKIGPNKKYNGVPLRWPQKNNTHNSIATLMESITSGSGQYRKIIMRERTKITHHPPGPWRKKLNDLSITNHDLQLTTLPQPLAPLAHPIPSKTPPF